MLEVEDTINNIDDDDDSIIIISSASENISSSSESESVTESENINSSSENESESDSDSVSESDNRSSYDSSASQSSSWEIIGMNTSPQPHFLEEMSEPEASEKQSENSDSKRTGEDEIQNDVCELCHSKRAKRSEDENVCSICLDHWGDSGPHQISSTKCGHLFGKSCILKWIDNTNPNSSKCPICKQKVKRRHIRPLFVGNLAVKH